MSGSGSRDPFLNNPRSSIEDWNPNASACDEFELKLRKILYYIFLLICFVLALRCYTEEEASVTLGGFAVLILVRILVNKWCYTRNGDNGSVVEGICNRVVKIISFVTYFGGTVILLSMITIVYYQSGRFGDGVGKKCASGAETPNVNGTNSSTASTPPVPISNSSAEGKCIIYCDTVYFYPMALLCFDLFCYLGLCNVLIIQTGIVLFKKFIVDPLYSKILSIFKAVLVIGIILYALYIVISFKFEFDPILCSFLLGLTVISVIQGIILVVSCVRKYLMANGEGEGGEISQFGQVIEWSTTLLVFVFLLMSGTMMSAPTNYFLYREYLKPGTNKSFVLEDDDVCAVPNSESFVSFQYTCGFWYLTGLLILFQAFIHWLVHYEKIQRTRAISPNKWFRPKMFVYVFLFPLFLTLLPMLLTMVVLCFALYCFCCLVGGGDGNTRYGMPDGTVVDYIPEGYRVASGWLF